MKVALFTFVPSFCPNCGRSLEIIMKDRYQLHDYLHSVSFSCSCGLYHEYITEDTVQDIRVDGQELDVVRYAFE